MAKSYKAATRIQHGMSDGSVKTFEVGDTVKGLTEDDMKQLWDAGALEASDGTTADAAAPDLTAEVRESVSPEGKSLTDEEVDAHAPGGAKKADETEKAKEPAKAPAAPAKATPATKSAEGSGGAPAKSA